MCVDLWLIFCLFLWTSGQPSALRPILCPATSTVTFLKYKKSQWFSITWGRNWSCLTWHSAFFTVWAQATCILSSSSNFPVFVYLSVLGVFIIQSPWFFNVCVCHRPLWKSSINRPWNPPPRSSDAICKFPSLLLPYLASPVPFLRPAITSCESHLLLKMSFSGSLRESVLLVLSFLQVVLIVFWVVFQEGPRAVEQGGLTALGTRLSVPWRPEFLLEFLCAVCSVCLE